MATPALILTTSAANLKRLATIRLILTIGLLAGLAYAKLATASDLIHPAHLTILALFALVNTLTYWRLQQPWPVTDLEYFTQLLFDIFALTVVLYTSGGATNPFVSYYLVPITISAALLPWRYTWIISTLSLAAYTLMLFYYQPLPDLQPNHNQHAGHGTPAINLHILGMWLTFAVSTALITYFVVKMANALRQHQQQQATHREDELRDEQIMAVATLAAGTAHELGTPLATMTVLLDEMIATNNTDEQLNEDLALLKSQLENCKTILAGLVNTAEIHSHNEKQIVDLQGYVERIVDHWQLMRPKASIDVIIDSNISRQQLLVDPTLEQAISNLLNNAADANPEKIEMTLRCDGTEAVIEVRDHGAGIAMDVAERIGKPFVSTKGKGLGLGLFLSHATINRYGGSIALHNHPMGGTVALLRLPLAKEQQP